MIQMQGNSVLTDFMPMGANITRGQENIISNPGHFGCCALLMEWIPQELLYVEVPSLCASKKHLKTQLFREAFGEFLPN